MLLYGSERIKKEEISGAKASPEREVILLTQPGVAVINSRIPM